MRVDWHLGQGLLPEHFLDLEESLQAENNLRFQMLHRPSWGVGDLEWDESPDQLGLQRLTLVFPSGTVIDVPGNARVNPLDLGQLAATSADVWVELLSQSETETTSAGDPDEEGIERRRLVLALSTEEPSGSAQSMKLARLVKGPQGKWTQDSHYIPPLLRVKRGALFEGPLREMEDCVKRLHSVLREEMLAHHLSGETQILAKQSLASLLSFRAVLADLTGEAQAHPYDLYAALRKLYIDVSVQRGDTELSVAEKPYDHDAVRESFDLVLGPLRREIDKGVPKVPYIELKLKGGNYHVKLPHDVNRAPSVYLLFQKPRMDTVLSLSDMKVSSPRRIVEVFERALTGIPYQKVDRPPFAATLDISMDIYQLQRGLEWDYAVKEGELVLNAVPGLAGCRLYIYFSAS
jgi:type VI secretion system protein ImpJ